MRPQFLCPLAIAISFIVAPVPLTLAAQAGAVAELQSYSLPAGPLEASLIAIGQRSGRQVVFLPDDVKGRQAHAVSGQMTAEQAVGQALQGSGLSLRVSASGALSVQPETGVLTLGVSTVNALSDQESAYGPVSGYVAKRSASATKTDTPIIETPQSISVVTRAEMDDRKSDTLADALGYTPGFVSQPNGFSRVADDYTLRGFNVGSGTGGVLLDGMKLQSSVYDGGIEPFGLERAEVLKGASSVLYGQLSPGGLINAVSKRPTDTPLHRISAEYGSHDRQQYTFDLAGPLDEEGEFSYRLNGLWRDSDTQVDHIRDDKRFIAPSFTWRPNEDTSLTVLASHTEALTGLTPPLTYAMTTYSPNPGRKIGRDDFVGEPGYDHFNSRIDTVGYLFEQRLSDTLKVRHALRYYQADVSWNYLIPFSISGNKLTRRYSERQERSTGWTSDNNVEWKIDAGRWRHTLLAGVDYYHKTYDTHRHISATVPQLAPTLDLSTFAYTGVGANTAPDSGWDIHSRQAGIYLQDQITLDDHWVLLMGGRQDWAESRNYSFVNQARTPRSDQKPTGRIALLYRFDNGIAPYASYSQSFQPADVANPGVAGTFDPIEGEQYEVGIRYQPPGANTLLSAALYSLTQTNALSYNSLTAQYEQYGKSRSKGLELEGKTDLTDNLSVTAGYTYTDAHVLEDNVASNVGKRLEGVPYHNASFWTDYRLAGFGLPQVKVGLGALYTGTTRTSPTITERKIPAYTRFDARVSYDIDEHWQLAAKAQNLTNESYLSCSTSCRYGDERSLIGTVSYQW
ncbi:iron complex outermembrane receptor protein [Pseudomonas sp. JUb42]|jgi:iron complex outermembrane receptor protein|uniref:TonB-dependent siderophore receptor n=1 Tax=Pseudomonas sp. JUb42 TaxID=2940611 RepID=UPI002168ABFB|nr:TonB-dependent siderophore receptor [Pseudomonas sp. JUb42]MCS3472241.1 iron complex outermembrane receptor protein [Pseudomonas sp. JUb42]